MAERDDEFETTGTPDDAVPQRLLKEVESQDAAPTDEPEQDDEGDEGDEEEEVESDGDHDEEE